MRERFQLIAATTLIVSAFALVGASLYTASHDPDAAYAYTFRFDVTKGAFEAWSSTLLPGQSVEIPVTMTGENATAFGFTLTWGRAGQSASTFALEAVAPDGSILGPVQADAGVLRVSNIVGTAPSTYRVNASVNAAAWASLNEAHPPTLARDNGEWRVRITYLEAVPPADANETLARDYVVRADTTGYVATLASKLSRATNPPRTPTNETEPSNTTASSREAGTDSAKTRTPGSDPRSDPENPIRFKTPAQGGDEETAPPPSAKAEGVDWVTLAAATGIGLIAGVGVILVGRKIA